MSITATCQNCEKVVRAKDSFAGKRVKCPQCKSPIELPTPNTASIAPPASPPQNVTEKKSRRGMIIASSVIGAATVIVVGVIVWVSSGQSDDAAKNGDAPENPAQQVQVDETVISEFNTLLSRAKDEFEAHDELHAYHLAKLMSIRLLPEQSALRQEINDKIDVLTKSSRSEPRKVEFRTWIVDVGTCLPESWAWDVPDKKTEKMNLQMLNDSSLFPDYLCKVSQVDESDARGTTFGDRTGGVIDGSGEVVANAVMYFGTPPQVTEQDIAKKYGPPVRKHFEDSHVVLSYGHIYFTFERRSPEKGRVWMSSRTFRTNENTKKSK